MLIVCALRKQLGSPPKQRLKAAPVGMRINPHHGDSLDKVGFRLGDELPFMYELGFPPDTYFRLRGGRHAGRTDEARQRLPNSFIVDDDEHCCSLLREVLTGKLRHDVL